MKVAQFLAVLLIGFLLGLSVPRERSTSVISPPLITKVAPLVVTRVVEVERVTQPEKITNAPPTASKDVAESDPRVSWRVGAISKIVNLNESEIQLLTERFKREASIRAARPPREELESQLSELEPIDSIIGADKAAAYRQHVVDSIKRIENEELEKEVLYLARKLGLNSQEESELLKTYNLVESELNQRSEDNKGLQASDRVTQMIKDQQIRRELLSERLKETLSSEQYRGWLGLEADSAKQELSIFHSR